MTERQKIIYDFIQAFIKVKGFSPSYSEIAQGMGMTSKSNIHRHIHALRERGLLHIKPHMIRSMKVCDASVRHVSNL